MWLLVTNHDPANDCFAITKKTCASDNNSATGGHMNIQCLIIYIVSGHQCFWCPFFVPLWFTSNLPETTFCYNPSHIVIPVTALCISHTEFKMNGPYCQELSKLGQSILWEPCQQDGVLRYVWGGKQTCFFLDNAVVLGWVADVHPCTHVGGRHASCCDHAAGSQASLTWSSWLSHLIPGQGCVTFTVRSFFLSYRIILGMGTFWVGLMWPLGICLIGSWQIVSPHSSCLGMWASGGPNVAMGICSLLVHGWL